MGNLSASGVLFGILIITCLLIIKINGAKRLKCFNCIHMEGESFHDFDDISEDSCKDGERTRRKLRVNCYDTLPNHNDARGKMVNLIREMRDHPENKTRLIPAFTCAKFTFKGNFREHPLEATIRTCIPSHRHIHSFSQGCHEGESKAVIERVDTEVAQFITNFTTFFGPSCFETKVCTCQENSCNFSNRLGNNIAITVIFGVFCVVIYVMFNQLTNFFLIK